MALSTRAQRVLVVDDIADNVLLLKFELEDDGFLVDSAENGAMCLEKVSQQSPDIILLDIRMPGMSGIDVLAKLKADDKSKDIPVVMVSANSEEENIIQALDLGAHDFVSKPIEYPILSARMRSALRLTEVLEDLEAANTELQRLASIDPLTNCYNRRYFFELAEAEVSRAKRHNRPLSAVMLDVDSFKAINDKYGHAGGDLALEALSELCLTMVRDSDIFGRLGGEEFGLCCPETDLAGAVVIAEKIRNAYQELVVYNGDTEIRTTLSLGVTTINDQDRDFDHLLQRADALLYQAKNQGRNRTISSGQ